MPEKKIADLRKDTGDIFMYRNVEIGLPSATSGYVFLDDATLFKAADEWMNPRSAVEAIGSIASRLQNPTTTCDEAKTLLRRRAEIINAWCAGSGADEVPGGPFEHDLRGINPHTGEPALVWVINGDILDTTPIEGPAVAAREWVRRFGQKEAS